MSSEKITLRILVKPNAKPSEGEANLELCRFLSKWLEIPKTKIILERGEKSRHKVVSLPQNERLRKILENPFGSNELK